MNGALARLAAEAPLPEPLCLAFGLACVSRIEHLLQDARAMAGLDALRRFVAGTLETSTLRAAAAELQQIANRHRGSNTIDGGAHAAVSATYAVANALAGRALAAADYAAYAAVYAYGAYAVGDPGAFEPEFAWQVEQWKALAVRAAGGEDGVAAAPGAAGCPG